MKKPTLLLAILFLFGCSFPVFGQFAINGEWTVNRAIVAGELVDAALLSSMSLKIDGNGFDAKSGEGNSKGTIAEEGSDGRRIKMVLKIESGDDAGREIKAIYQLNRSNLKIVFSQDDQFPNDTRSTAENRFVVVSYNKKKSDVANSNKSWNGKPRIGFSASSADNK